MGDIQKSGDQVRINVKLIDALTGKSLWAEKYDRSITDLFAMQDDITMQVMKALQVELYEGANHQQTMTRRRSTTLNLPRRRPIRITKFSEPTCCLAITTIIVRSPAPTAATSSMQQRTISPSPPIPPPLRPRNGLSIYELKYNAAPNRAESEGLQFAAGTMATSTQGTYAVRSLDETIGGRFEYRAASLPQWT